MNLPKITSAMFILTHACNLCCRYCFVHQEPSFMTYETALDATKFLIKNAEESGDVPSINYFGGEPMVMWDSIIVPLTNWIRKEYKKPFSLSMTSNCTLLDDERIKFMKDNQIGLLFSIDGAKATQDYNRSRHDGGSSFDMLEPLIPKIAKEFPNTTFRMTVIPDTCHHLFENIMFAEQNGFGSFFVVPNIFEHWSEQARETLKKEFRKFTDWYIDSYREGKEPIFFSTLDSAFSDIKQINKAILNQNFRSSNKCRACGKCGLGSGRFASIHPNGNIYGCQEMTSNEGEESIFYIGNVYSGVKEDRRTALMALYDKEPAKGEYCETCKYNRICDGGCVANNYLINGSLTKTPEMFCWWRMFVLDEAIRIMQILGKEENALFRKKWSRTNG